MAYLTMYKDATTGAVSIIITETEEEAVIIRDDTPSADFDSFVTIPVEQNRIGIWRFTLPGKARDF